MAKDFTNITQENRKFFTSIKDSGFFKILKEGEPFIAGFAYSIDFDLFEKDWHGINAAFFYNYATKQFYVNSKCGCMSTSRAVRANINDLNFLRKKLAESKLIFNRKTKKVI